MLPDSKNIAEIYELIAKFEENQHNRTNTFAIEERGGVKSDPTSSILGIGKLGVLRLNTYKIQTSVEPDHVLSGMIDGLAALRQSIYLLLGIESDQYIIYPYTYGLQTIDLYGKSSDYVMSIIPERITDALLRDDRIESVSDFEFVVNGNKLTVKFVVHSIYGDIEEETAVIY